jgi:hypothetical protein
MIKLMKGKLTVAAKRLTEVNLSLGTGSIAFRSGALDAMKFAELVQDSADAHANMAALLRDNANEIDEFRYEFYGVERPKKVKK